MLKKERIIDGGSASGGGGGKMITHRPERVVQKKNKIVHQGILRLGIFFGEGNLAFGLSILVHRHGHGHAHGRHILHGNST